MKTTNLTTTALCTCLFAGLAGLPAAAQTPQSDGQPAQSTGQTGTQTEQSGQTDTQTGQSAQSSQSNAADQSQQPGQAFGPNVVVATVGEEDILGSEVVEFISSLPPRMRDQPPEIVTAMAVDQVILRELLLQEARSQNLGDDPRVNEIAERNAEIARDDAMVAVFLQDQLSQRVSDAAVQQTYEDLQGQVEDAESLPALEQIRPQIERQLQQQALQELRAEIEEGIAVVVYGAGETPEGETSGGGTSGGASNGTSEGGSDSASEGGSENTGAGSGSGSDSSDSQ